MQEKNNYQGLTSLMKERFGVTKSSPLRLTEKDTLYTAFRKLADNIYKNGEWTAEDEMQAVNTMMRNRHCVSIGTEEITYLPKRGADRLSMRIDVAPISDKEKLILGDRLKNFSGYTATVTKKTEKEESNAKKSFILLDPENKKGTVHNKHYYFDGMIAGYWDGTNSTDTIYYALGNKNRAIGYDRLQRDILKEFDKRAVNSEIDGVSRGDMELYLRQLIDPDYSGKKWQSKFLKHSHGELTDEFLATLPRDESTRYWSVPPTKEEIDAGRAAFNYRDLTEYPESRNKLNLDEAPYILERSAHARSFIYPDGILRDRKHNKIVDFVQNYIENTYDFILQHEYEKAIEKQVRASAWQTKKNINKETQNLMEQTSLNEYFGFVEVDNDVDLELFGHFEEEMKKIHEILPKTEARADLRLRKLGNYHALGLYHSGTQTISIDFRDYSDNIAGIGIQSFIHEYGHFLDYTGEQGLLSMKDGFRPFVARYREKIQLLPGDSYVKNKSNYYSAPTEVFARSFEIYTAECGLRSNFIQSKEAYQVLDDYRIIDSDMRKELFEYFDQQFPEFKHKIREFNGLPALEKQVVDAEKTAEPTMQSVATQEKDLAGQLGDFLEQELDYLEKTVAVYLHEKTITDPEYGLDMDFSVYEKKDHSAKLLTEKERAFVDSWLSANVSPKKELQLLRVRDAIQSVKQTHRVEQSNHEETFLSEEMFIQSVESAAAEHDFKEEEAIMMDEATKKISALKNLELSLDGKIIPLGKALDHCELSLLTKEEAIKQQESEIEKYEQFIPQSETSERIALAYKEQLAEIKTLSTDTLLLFDASDTIGYSKNAQKIISDIVELPVFKEAYGKAIYDFSDVTSDFGLYVDQTELANQTNQEYIQDGGEYIPIQTTEQMNQLLDNGAAVALPEVARPFVEEFAKHVPITNDWTFDEIGYEYAEYKANGVAFHMERAEMDTTYDQTRSELVERLMKGDIELEAMYDEVVLQQLSPEAQQYWKDTLNLHKEPELTAGESSEKQETLFDNLISTYPDEIVQGMKAKSVDNSQEMDRFTEAKRAKELNNRYLQVEFNESNPSGGIQRYQGKIVTPELILELESMERNTTEVSRNTKFYFDEVIDGKVVDNYNMSIGDGFEVNRHMYDFLKAGAVNQERAASIKSGLVVAGGKGKDGTSSLTESKSADRYYRVASNEIYPPIFQENYSGQIVTQDFVSDLYKWAGQATYPNPASVFSFEEVVNGKVVDTIDLEIGGGNFEEKKLIFDRLSEGTVNQEQPYEYTIQAKTIDNKIIFDGKEKDHERGSEYYQELVIESDPDGIKLSYYGSDTGSTYEGGTEEPYNEEQKSLIVQDLPENLDERIKHLLSNGSEEASISTFNEIEQIYLAAESYQTLEKDRILTNLADQYGLVLDKAFSSKDYEQIFGYPAARTEKEILTSINQQRNEKIVDWAYRETYSPEEIEFYKEDRVLNLQKKLVDGHMFYQIDEQTELLLQPSKENSSQFDGMIFNQLGGPETFSADSPRGAAEKLAELGASPCSKGCMSVFKEFLSQENNKSHQQHLIHNRVMQETYREETGRSMGR